MQCPAKANVQQVIIVSQLPAQYNTRKLINFSSKLLSHFFLSVCLSLNINFHHLISISISTLEMEIEKEKEIFLDWTHPEEFAHLKEPLKIITGYYQLCADRLARLWDNSINFQSWPAEIDWLKSISNGSGWFFSGCLFCGGPKVFLAPKRFFFFRRRAPSQCLAPNSRNRNSPIYNAHRGSKIHACKLNFPRPELVFWKNRDLCINSNGESSLWSTRTNIVWCALEH